MIRPAAGLYSSQAASQPMCFFHQPSPHPVIEEAAANGWAVIVLDVESEYIEMDAPSVENSLMRKLSSFEKQAEGVVFAVKAKGIYQLLEDLKKNDTTYQSIKLPSGSSLKNLDREQQIKQVQDCVYQIKVYN